VIKKGGVMRLVVILVGIILLASVVMAGEKEELTYQNINLRIQNLSLQIQMTVQDRDKVIAEMQKQGYTFDQQGNFTRPVTPKEEPKKEPKK
jgi:hypothetical protein